MFNAAKYGWVGFDIGAASVKVAQLLRRDGQFVIGASAVAPRRPKWPANTRELEAPLTSADEIRCAASLCNSIKGATAAAMLPIELCEVVNVAAPNSKRGGNADLVRTVEAETQRSMRGHLIDAWPTSLPSGRLNAIAAPCAWSDRISVDMGSAGWDCQVIDALPWALARAVTLASPGDEAQTVAALDWGLSRATMFLIHRGTPTLVRTLKDSAYQSVLDTIAAGLRLHERDAEVVLRQFGLRHQATGADASVKRPAQRGDSSRVVHDLLAKHLSHLAHEIHRTLAYWHGITRGQMPQALYLFGGGGALSGADQELSSALSLRVEPWRLPVAASNGDLVAPTCLLGAAVGLSALAWEAS